MPVWGSLVDSWVFTYRTLVISFEVCVESHTGRSGFDKRGGAREKVSTYCPGVSPKACEPMDWVRSF